MFLKDLFFHKKHCFSQSQHNLLNQFQNIFIQIQTSVYLNNNKCLKKRWEVSSRLLIIEISYLLLDQQINKEFPTMLHFGAKYGLSCFCKVLSRVPGFQIARTIRNKYDQTPGQLAQKMKFLDLAEQLNPADTRVSNRTFKATTRL